MARRGKGKREFWQRFFTTRDKNEPEIIRALQRAGAFVRKLNGNGIPDLLVGYCDRTYLLEVKNPRSKNGKAKAKDYMGGRGELTPQQVKFFDGWKGRKPAIVHNPREALDAIKAPSDTCRLCGGPNGTHKRGCHGV